MNDNRFQDFLLNWHLKHKRYLPWRKTRDPYKILISEILLQKTDYSKIKQIYPRFIDKYPTIEYIHQASLEEIEPLFKNIGLFYKAKRIKKISENLIYKFNGKVPENREDLLSLYGVGEYICNATLCFAFNKKVPIVDSNIIRIFERVFCLYSPISRPHMDKDLWCFAESLLPDKLYKEYNYSLLDFSSIICRNRSPLCVLCPIMSICNRSYNMCKQLNHL